MQYFGGKNRLANEIVSILNSYRKENQKFVEPFVGGLNIVSKMEGERLAFDLHYELIELYKAMQNGWIPPDAIDNDTYLKAKNSNNISPAFKAFVGFGCSFAGKYFGGFAKNSRNENYCKSAQKALLKKISTCQNVVFENKDYRTLKFENCLIYCDPPFHGVTQYSNGKFDSEEFWRYMREWSKNNTVIVSEYNAPSDFECIWAKETKTEIRTKANGREKRVEKLFKYKNNG